MPQSVTLVKALRLVTFVQLYLKDFFCGRNVLNTGALFLKFLTMFPAARRGHFEDKVWSEILDPVGFEPGGAISSLSSRAGHATTLPRQCDHVLRPQHKIIDYYIMSIFVVASSLTFRHPNLNISYSFSGH